jgi:hypothetical protein
MNHGDFAESVRPKLFRQETFNNGSLWQSQDILDLPLAQEIPEGTQYTQSRIAQGLSKTFTPTKYGGMVGITKEMIQDARFDTMGNWARKLGEALSQTREIGAVNLYNNAFSSELAEDGLSLINSAHVVGAQTFSNVISGNPDLSETALQAALAQFETAFIRSNGTYINIRPRILVVHPSNKRYAMELVGSSLKPDSADNNLNSILQDNLMVVSSPYFTDPDAWFLQAEPSKTGMVVVNRQGIETSSTSFNDGPGFTTDSALIKASYREAIGVTHARGILGSSGT